MALFPDNCPISALCCNSLPAQFRQISPRQHLRERRRGGKKENQPGLGSNYG